MAGGNRGQAPRVAMRGSQFETRNGQAPARSPCAQDDFVCSEAQPAPRLDRVRIDKPRGAGIVVNRNPHIFQLLAPGSMFADVTDDLARAREQPGVIQDWLAHRDTILAELFSFSKPPRCLGKYPHGNGAVIRCHTPYLAAGDQNRLGAQLCSPECSNHAGRTGANDHDIHTGLPQKSSVLCLEEKFISSMLAILLAELLLRVASCLSNF